VQANHVSKSFNEDEVSDLEAEKVKIAKILGTTKEELFSQLEPLQALYASADHTLTLLFTVTDGMLPSNAGGGYNLRMILRRVFGFENRFRLNLNYEEILKGHASHLEYMFPHLKNGVETTLQVIDEERKKYAANKENARTKMTKLVEKGEKITANELFVLYKSHGIPPEYVTEMAKEKKVPVEVPGNFYVMAREKDERTGEEESGEKIDITNYPKTEVLYYGSEEKFEAKVLGVAANKYVILDKTGFYPESGGQVADLGKLNESEVKNVIKQAGVVLVTKSKNLQNSAKEQK